MRSRWALAVLAVAGCNRMFGLERPPIDGPPGADAAIDAPPDAPCPTRTAAIVHDGILDANNMTLPGSRNGLMHIRFEGGLNTVGILKFDLTSHPEPTGITLFLPHAVHDAECGGCTSPCAAIEDAGEFYVYAMTSDWDEQDEPNRGATWNCRRGPSGCVGNDRWLAPGASHPAERTGEVGRFTSTPGLDTWVRLTDPSLAWGERAGDRLSFQIVPKDGSGGVIIRTHDHVCDRPAATPSLELEYCGTMP